MDSFGLVLAGGGTRGAYQIGVWKALLEAEIPVCAVAGVSIGGILDIRHEMIDANIRQGYSDAMQVFKQHHLA